MGFQSPPPHNPPATDTSALEQALEIQIFQMTEDISQNKVRKTWDQVVETINDDENDPDRPPKIST